MSVSIRINLRTEECQLSFSFSLSLAVAGTLVEGMAHNRGGMMPSSALSAPADNDDDYNDYYDDDAD